MPENEYYLHTIEESLKILGSNRQGLAEEEAQKRLKKFGLNALPEEKKSPRFLLLLRQFNSSLVYILLIASVISFMLGDVIDAGVILAAVAVNIILGFFQEYRAAHALEKLKKAVSSFARVRRMGRETEINAIQLVPGDIVLIKAGDKVPADGRVISEADFEVNEASLTGESMPVKKSIAEIKENKPLADRTNCLFMGTIAVAGLGEMVVVNTGWGTEMGAIANLIKKTGEERTPFQKKLDLFSRAIGIMTLAVVFVLLVAGLIEGKPFVEMFTTSVAVAVSAIPEGLTIAVTAILAIGMQRILKRRALVKKLASAETLGSTTVICTDKTGTLTMGKMCVSNLVTLNHDLVPGRHLTAGAKTDESLELTSMLKIAVHCNDAVIQNPDDGFSLWKMIGNPTEKALMVMGAEMGFYRKDMEKEKPRLDEIPFSSDKKYMLTLHKRGSGTEIYVKGAPEIVLKMSVKMLDGKSEKPMNDGYRRKFEEKFRQMSSQGLRILAFGYQIIPKTVADFSQMENIDKLLGDFTFVGLVGIKDPLRPETKETIKLCRNAGIKIVMITGDHKLTAQAIAGELGINCGPDNILEGSELENISEVDLAGRIKNISVYARVASRDKLKIVNAWKSNGEVVAMTGDGINDAPALKAADIGIALGSGSDVAKEASDMVILDDNFKSIVAAVEEGRVIFDNIKKVILYLLADSFTEIIIIAGAIIIGGFFINNFPLPIIASQILWINLVNDSLPSIALTAETGEKEVMEESPEGRKKPIFTPQMKAITAVISIITGLGNLLLFWYLIKHGWDLTEARTIIFANIGLDSLLYVFSVRSLRKSIFRINIFSNPFIIYSVIISAALQISAIYWKFLNNLLGTRPLALNGWLIVLIAIITTFVISEMAKRLFFKKIPKTAVN